jgi:uncharacterized protein HemY
MPLTKTKTYAQILETQGFKEEALAIYEELLKKEYDKEIEEAIQRLKKRKSFDNVNLLRLKEFDNINQLNRYEFEKWLSEM